MGEFRKSGGFAGDRNNSGREFRRKDFGGRPSFGNRRGGFGGGRDGRQAQMFPATCAQCNKACEVPFRPTGDKPVYCSNCFSAKRDDSPRNFPRRDSAPQNKPQINDAKIDELKKQIDTINSKLDKLMEMIGNKAKKTIAKKK